MVAVMPVPEHVRRKREDREAAVDRAVQEARDEVKRLRGVTSELADLVDDLREEYGG